MAFGIVDEPGALAAQVVVDLAQRTPQLANRLACLAAAALEGRQD
jgi:hypothetical protein